MVDETFSDASKSLSQPDWFHTRVIFHIITTLIFRGVKGLYLTQPFNSMQMILK